MRIKWDVLMLVTGWVKIGEVETEGDAEPFESNLVDRLEMEGSLEVEKNSP